MEQCSKGESKSKDHNECSQEFSKLQAHYNHCLSVWSSRYTQLEQEKTAQISQLEKRNMALLEDMEIEKRKFIVGYGNSIMDKNKLQSENKKLITHYNNVQKKTEKLIEDNNKLQKENEKSVDENKSLQMKNKELIDENDRLAKELIKKSQDIYNFVNNQVEVIRGTDKKQVFKFYKAFKENEFNLSACSSDIVQLTAKVEQIKQVCTNCRASHEKERNDYEQKIKLLEDEKVNFKFINQQQTVMITQLKEDIEMLKIEISCMKKNFESRFEKEKVEVFPLTPDTWSEHEDNEDCYRTQLSNEIKISDNFDKYPQTALEIKKKLDCQEDTAPQSRNRQKEFSSKNLNCDSIESISDSESESLESRKNLYKKVVNNNRGRKRKNSLKEIVEEDKTIDHCGIKVTKAESFAHQYNEDDSLMKVKEVGVVKRVSLENCPSVNYKNNMSLPVILSNLPTENLSPVCEKDVSMPQTLIEGSIADKCFLNDKITIDDSETTSFPLMQTSSKETISVSSLESNLTPKILTDLGKQENEVLILNINESLNKRVPVEENQITPPVETADNDSASIIGSEGWSPPYSFFEPIFHQFIQCPELISPIRPCLRKSSKKGNNKKDIKNDSSKSNQINIPIIAPLEEHKKDSENAKPPKSIFSPVISSNNHNNDVEMLEAMTEDSSELCFETTSCIEEKRQTVSGIGESNTVFVKTDDNIYKRKEKQLKSEGNYEIKEAIVISSDNIKVLGDIVEHEKIINRTRKTGGESEQNPLSCTPSAVCTLSANQRESRNKSLGNKHVVNKDTSLSGTEINKEIQETSFCSLQNGIKPSKLKYEKVSVKTDENIEKLNPNLLPNSKPTIKGANQQNDKLSKLFTPERREANYKKLDKTQSSKHDYIEECKPLDLSLSKCKGFVSKKGKEFDFSLSISSNTGRISKYNEEIVLKQKSEYPDSITLDEKSRPTKEGGVQKSGMATWNCKVLSLPTEVTSKEAGLSQSILSPDTTTSTDVKDSFSSTKLGERRNRFSKEIKFLNENPLPPSISNSPQTNANVIAIRSPNALKHYGLRLSPKGVLNSSQSTVKFQTSKNVQALVSPILIKGLVNSNVSIDEHFPQCSPKCVRSKHLTLLSPRFSESVNHHNMRLNIPQTKCNNLESRDYVVEQKHCKRKLSYAKQPSTEQKPLNLNNISVSSDCNLTDHNSIKSDCGKVTEMQIESSKDDSEALEVKLKFTHQERMLKLKDHANLLKPVNVIVNYNPVNNISVLEINSKQAPVTSDLKSVKNTCVLNFDNNLKERSSDLSNLHINNANYSAESDCTINNGMPKSDQAITHTFGGYKNATIKRPQEKNNILKPKFSYSKSAEHTFKCDLVKIANKSVRRSAPTILVSNTCNSEQYVPRTYRGSLRKRSQNVSNSFLMPPDSYSSGSPALKAARFELELNKTSSTKRVKNLFRADDLTYKFISYRTSLFNGKGKIISDDIRYKTQEVISCDKATLCETEGKSSVEAVKKVFNEKSDFQGSEKDFDTLPTKNNLKQESIFRPMDHNIKKITATHSADGCSTKCKSDEVTLCRTEEQSSDGTVKKVANESSKFKSSEKGLEPKKKNLKQKNIFQPENHNMKKNTATNSLNGDSTKCKGGHVSHTLREEDNNSIVDDEDLLLIDIDEDLMHLTDSILNSSCVESTKLASTSEVTCSVSPDRGFSVKEKSNQKDSRCQKLHKKCSSSGCVDCCKDITEDLPFIRSCDIPCYQPLPKEMCKYKEVLALTNTDFSLPENRVPPFTVECAPYKCNQTLPLASNTTQLVNNVYVPKFYIEHNSSVEENLLQPSQQQTCTKEEEMSEEFDKDAINSEKFELQSFEELVPKGEKIKVTANVVRTVISKHKEDVLSYKERNMSERRVNNIQLPEELVQSVVEILNPFLYEDVEHLLEIVKLAAQLQQYSSDVILKGLMLSLNKKVTEASLKKNSKATWMLVPYQDFTPLHPKIQAVIALLLHVNNQKMKGKNKEEKVIFVKGVLCFLEEAFIETKAEFNDTIPVFWYHLGLMYTALARHYGKLARVRKLLYDMLYCFTKRSLAFALAVLNVWPSFIKIKPIEAYYHDPLALTIILQLATPRQSSSQYGQIMQKLNHLMMNRYKFRADTITADQIFDICLRRLGQRGVYEAVVLLAKRMPPKWFINRPMYQLIAVVEEWWKGGEECCNQRVIYAIKILCSVLKAYVYENVENEVQTLCLLLKEVLTDPNTPSWMQEVIVLNSCRLSRLNMALCLDLVACWKPLAVSTEVLEQILVDIVCKRTPIWWERTEIALTYLNKT